MKPPAVAPTDMPTMDPVERLWLDVGTGVEGVVVTGSAETEVEVELVRDVEDGNDAEDVVEVRDVDEVVRVVLVMVMLEDVVVGNGKLV